MKIINESNIVIQKVDGSRGSVDVIDVLTGAITAGVRIVRPFSDVPKKTHAHPEKQVIYVIEGRASITNGVDTYSIGPGDFIILHENEEHYVITDAQEVKLFEIKYEVCNTLVGNVEN